MNFWQKLKLSSKPFLVLAPMDGVTDFVFREVISEIAKPDVLFTEFTNVDALFSDGYERTIHRLKYSEKQRPIVAQIWGINPENFFNTAVLVHKLGFDGIDINMGCPDRSVMKMGSGISLLNNPSLASEIITATREGAKEIPVSVKTRIGLDYIVTDTWIKFLLEQKPDALTVHGRTAKELSSVPNHWEEIKKSVEIRNNISPNTVMIGNGDVLNREEATKTCEESGVDGIMIGRGIFANPWLFENSPKEHTTRERLELLLKHTKLYCEIYPESKKFDVMKKFFKVYVKSFSGAGFLKTQLMETKNYSEVQDIIKSYLLNI